MPIYRQQKTTSTTPTVGTTSTTGTGAISTTGTGAISTTGKATTSTTPTVGTTSTTGMATTTSTTGTGATGTNSSVNNISYMIAMTPSHCINDGSCYYMDGCTNPVFLEYWTQGGIADHNDGSCVTPVVFGCMEEEWLEYNPNANWQRDGDCGSRTPVVPGCMDLSALNYDNEANRDDGSCNYIGAAFAEGIRREKEIIADALSNMLIEHTDEIKQLTGKEKLSDFQKTIKGGTIQRGREESQKLILWESDVKANHQNSSDTISMLYNMLYPDNANPNTTEAAHEINDLRFEFYTKNEELGGGTFARVLFGTSQTSQEIDLASIAENLNQFVDFSETIRPIDATKARDVLDTTIFELLGAQSEQQQRINDFFTEYQALKPTETPIDRAAVIDADDDGFTDSIDERQAGRFSADHDISGTHSSDVEDTKSITWRKTSEDSDNANQSLEYLYDDLRSNFFPERPPEFELEDDRPQYEPQSDGYLEIRHLNQAIIVRNETQSDIGLIGPDPTSPKWQTDGFTITMWVRFLDKVSSGTLFNFGNPLRESNPYGFRLETYTLQRDTYHNSDQTYGQKAFQMGAPYFQNSDSARFIRLLVRDGDGVLRDSSQGYKHPTAMSTAGKNYGKQAPYLVHAAANSGYNSDYGYDASLFDFQTNLPYGTVGAPDVPPGHDSPSWLLPYTNIPVKLDEWYFIVANYDPTRNENYTQNIIDPDYWKWKCSGTTDPGQGEGDTQDWAWYVCDEDTYTADSLLGSKSKVEIISRSDLLRAKGLLVEESEEEVEPLVEPNSVPPPPPSGDRPIAAFGMQSIPMFEATSTY